MFNQPIAEITAFEIQNPKISLPQKDLIQWTAQAHVKAESVKAGKHTLAQAQIHRIEKLFSRYGVNSSQIGFRSFDLTDVLNPNWEELEIYRFGNSEDKNNTPHGKSIRERTEYFLQRSTEIFKNFYIKSSSAPNHMIHVTCTGYASPSPAQRLVDENEWSEITNVTHAYHMGCYASMPAIRIGEGLISSMKGRCTNSDFYRVDIVHTEMCSLHMNPLVHSPEQIVVQTLFADGHIKYSLVPSGVARNGFSILNISEQLIPGSRDDMSWMPSSWGMQMTLSRKVPEKIASHLKPFLEKLLAPTGFTLAEALQKAKFAIHPGGPKIIYSIQNILELQDEQVETSKEVLFQRGNMSSATLPHVWKSIFDQGVHSGRLIISLAFGPGLTLFGSVFKVI